MWDVGELHRVAKAGGGSVRDTSKDRGLLNRRASGDKEGVIDGRASLAVNGIK